MLKRVLIFLIASVSCTTLMAQEVKSPYSSVGLGTLYGNQNAANAGMGGIGIGTPSLNTINDYNPALLHYNLFTTFQVGATYESRTIEGKNFSGTNAKVTNADADLTNLSFSVPLMKRKWSLALGLKPYSLIDYSKIEESKAKILEQNGNPISTTVKSYKELTGSGGINRAYLSTGAKIYKGLSVGVTGNLYFGSINRNEIITPRDSLLDSSKPSDQNHAITPSFSTAYIEQIIVRQLKVDFGIAYRADLKEDLILHVGAVYKMGGNINAESIQTFERRFRQSEDSPLNIEKEISDNDFTIKMPSEFGLGFSFLNPNKWTVGADFTTADWSKYRNPITKDEEFLGRSYRFALGGEITPDATSIKNYLSRMTYRLGAFYEQTPYIVGGEKIKDWGATAGFSMPIRYSSIDFSFKYGQRGTLTPKTYKENYYQITMGVTFGDNSWFIKRKYD